MKRRAFLKKFGIGVGVATVTPMVITSLVPKAPEAISAYDYLNGLELPDIHPKIVEVYVNGRPYFYHRGIADTMMKFKTKQAREYFKWSTGI